MKKNLHLQLMAAALIGTAVTNSPSSFPLTTHPTLSLMAGRGYNGKKKTKVKKELSPEAQKKREEKMKRRAGRAKAQGILHE